jgi:hypothetical protein
MNAVGGASVPLFVCVFAVCVCACVCACFGSFINSIKGGRIEIDLTGWGSVSTILS